MKKNKLKLKLLAILLSVAALFSSPIVSGQNITPKSAKVNISPQIGDVNLDGEVNNLDRLILTRYLAGWDGYNELSINKATADVNGDGAVNNLDRLVLTRYLAGWDGYEIGGKQDSEEKTTEEATEAVTEETTEKTTEAVIEETTERTTEETTEESTEAVTEETTEKDTEKITEEATEETTEGTTDVKCRKFVYGKSELGRDLVCYEFTQGEYDKTILLNFAIHGYEDEYNADGQVLVDTANKLIDYYKSPDGLNNTRILIVPCANPDGLYSGYTNNGYGRCNANGVDLNRDFDANYKSYLTERNYTEYAFSASESRALRDLFYQYKPGIVLDFHGWLNYTIGDSELAEVFYKDMGLSHYVSFTSTNASGYFANWAHQNGALGLLVEFTNSNSVSIEKLKSAINDLIKNKFDGGTGEYELNEQLGKFQNISCYANTQSRITTYAFFNTPFNTTSYIDGAIDRCNILKIYKNGWVKVDYPISSGTKTGYCYLSSFIDPDISVTPYEIKLSQTTATYTTSDLTKEFGSMWPSDTVYVIADDGNAMQLIYSLDSGGWKMGWIKKA